MATLLCTKSEGLFSSEYVFTVWAELGRIQFFADVSWARPFGVEVEILETSRFDDRVLVRLPNGEGAAVVRIHQLVNYE